MQNVLEQAEMQAVVWPPALDTRRAADRHHRHPDPHASTGTQSHTQRHASPMPHRRCRRTWTHLWGLSPRSLLLSLTPELPPANHQLRPFPFPPRPPVHGPSSQWALDPVLCPATKYEDDTRPLPGAHSLTTRCTGRLGSGGLGGRAASALLSAAAGPRPLAGGPVGTRAPAVHGGTSPARLRTGPEAATCGCLSCVVESHAAAGILLGPQEPCVWTQRC